MNNSSHKIKSPIEKMGSSVNTAINNVSQSSRNTIFQSSQNVCQGVCTNLTRDINIMVSDGSRVGPIDLTQSCTASALCAMKTELSSIAEQQLMAVQRAQAEAPGQGVWTWPGFSVNTTVNTTHQTLDNSVTQIINNVCDATVSNTIENVNVEINKDSRVGRIVLNQTGNAPAACSIDNIAKAMTTQKESSDQTAISKSGGTSVLIVAIIAIAVVVVALAYIRSSQQKRQKDAQQKKLTTQQKAEVKEALKSIKENPKQIAQLLQRSGRNLGSKAPVTSAKK